MDLKPREIAFHDYPEFRPNLSPAQALWKGSFGGVYFDPAFPGTNPGELPEEWVKGLPDNKWKTPSLEYSAQVNCYKVACGCSQRYWEEHGWIRPQDPRGWFQWYCRFYLGRRTEDDPRQITRWLRLAGPRGRFRRQLIRLCVQKGKPFNDIAVSPVIRQTLLHWGYELTKKDFDSARD
jgi:hypothetical protein